MKICRFNNDRLGLVDGDEVIDVTDALEVIPTSGWPSPQGDALIANLDIVCSRASALANSGERFPLSELSLKSPVANPTKVIGAPVNYYAHQDEAIEDEGVSFGREIKTIESVAEGSQLSDVQEAFIDTGAIQCGFCTPGLLVTIHDFLDSNPEPEESEIKEAISGNLCRCTGYGRIVEAVQLVSIRRSGRDI